MSINRKLKSYLPIIVVLAIILYSAAGIDYSEAGNMSFDMVKSVLSGLFHPDWGYIYDGSGEDLMSLLLLTIGIAFLGTVIATVLALPLTFISAHNLWKSNTIVSKIGKFICNVLRAFPELVYAIIFVKMVGPGPFAGVLAIGVHQIGMLGKLYTEEIESMDEAPVESMTAVGANFWQTMFYARLPQLIPTFLSLALNHFEIAVRSAATLGLVGAGGIGAPMIFAIQSRAWDKVGIILFGIIITVFLIDAITGYLRKKLQ
ncbi:phosphonate ABC transporter, permease PhnE [Enterococcus sp. 7E2_DIV0204]|uniref:Phosphonate ABC transporter, permease PhnE n=1 Tax=Candidatus Enterococcus lemimoniae TaxID=1834167 RepID=A0ABZ2TAN5_9ENTE|nr:MULTISPECIES: phosphonate ABC transporter, permease protein PhnE [unclassified Enterococcus]OTN89285.1 phosphonate ABC transporter, permease PhnE [Enterococcus sp. 7E2_DIV0204]OTO68133.1 phosphonate ABC transporter, permease PhnE [Enterococcus sp. 12C11_DIV0727]OTP51731.1 phosphonate ABC transporter, permease PhnE [Enterococcus sp. 7D2_DIV0200]